MAEKKSAAPKRDSKPSGPFTLTTGWAAAILALLVILFFHEVSVGGRTFVSPDATNPVGFVRIGEQSLWQDKVYPLWNPFVFLGMPSFGSGAYNPLIYPPDWPLALLQKVLPLPDLTWMLLYYFLGGLFAFLLAREWGARPEGALLGAVAFVFQPNLVAVGSHGHGSQLVNSAYLPLMLWLTSRWFRRGNLSDLGLLALAGGFQFLRGHLQICFYTWLAVGLYALVQFALALRTPAELARVAARAAAIGVAAGLAFALAGVYNLPLKDYAQYSIRGGGSGGGAGLDYATQWSMAPYELLSVVVPNAVGFGGATYWGGMPFTDYPNAYLGIVAVLLALPALLPGAPGGLVPRVFALVLAAVSLMVSFGHYFPLYGFLYEHVPQFNKFRIPVMIVLLFQMAAAVGAAWGWSVVLDHGARARGGKRDGALDRVLIAAAIVLVVAGLVAIAGSEAIRGSYVSMATSLKDRFTPEAANAAFAGFTADLGRVALTGLLAVGIAWMAAGGRMAASLASLGLLALLAFDTWPVSGKVMQPVIGEPVMKSLDYGRDDVVDFLGKQGPWGSFRVFAPYERDNRFAGFGVSLLGGYHAAKPQLYQDLTEPGTNLVLDPRLWGVLNVRYIALPQVVPPDQLGQVFGPVAPMLKSVYQGAGGEVFEFPFALPRASLVGGYGVVPDTGRVALDSLRAGTRDPSRFTWLAKDPKVALGPVDGGTATIEHYGLHDVKVAVRTPGAAILRLADLWYPDWTATVDGKPAEILRADHALRAVVVPAGEHVVEFRFVSRALLDGLRMSLGSVAAVLALIGAGWWMGRKRAAAPPAATEGA